MCAFTAWSSSLIISAMASSATDRLPSYEFERSEDTWVDQPGRACRESDQLKPFWAWPISRLRLRIEPDASGVPGTERDSAPTVWEESLPGGVCHWLAAIPPPGEFCGESPACLAAARAGRRTLDVLCEDCSSELCSRQAVKLDKADSFIVELPPHGGCVHMEQLPKFAGGVGRVHLTWENDWDSMVAVRVIAGVALMAGSQALRESSLVHAALGGAGSVVVISLVLVWLLVRELKSLNLTQSALSVAVLTTMFGAGVHTVSDWSIADLTAWIAVRDPYCDFPIGGILVMAIVVVVSCAILQGARLSQLYFASPEEPTGDVDFVIGSDGRRIDILPPAPLQQRCLGWMLWAMGVALLLRCSHDDAVSAAVFAAVLLRNRISNFFFGLLEESGASPEYFRPLISSSVYSEQSQRCTATAIAQLQNFIRGNPDEIDAVSDNSKLHLRRFSDCKVPHFTSKVLDDDNDGVRRCGCALL